MYYIYAIYNKKHRKIYIGQAGNIETRLKLHNNKTFKNSYTSGFDGEWQLIYREKVATRHEALIRERQLKSFRGREFVRQFIPR
ncbi:MAG: hypothetical protein A2Y57_00775 [Candidatus Woykebacteria bacterium RBG_13_40_7b]|uniref:GIY-YIG domain-containing protein n=1 Tax=Candidatus Woykebacteria bacterium RBG_13_40_7b TaxID=1802594 RepID=A0A1G1WAU2_9BACT|nr:MAG: hypothetical protein A2Y57_00775 [Candidatus Woykebacteria bacterium RBG_13_40_7b]